MADHGKSPRKMRDVSSTVNQNKVEANKPQTHSVSFQKVTYGGINGSYYTATTSRRTGSDGVCLLDLLSLKFPCCLFLMLLCVILLFRWRGKIASKLIEQQVKRHTRSPEEFMIRWAGELGLRWFWWILAWELAMFCRGIQSRGSLVQMVKWTQCRLYKT